MKTQRAPIEVFSLSFLDIISCAFGAVVMLILLAKNGQQGTFSDVSALSDVLSAINAAKSTQQDNQSQLDALRQINQSAQSQRDAGTQAIADMTAQLAQAQALLASLNDQAATLQAQLQANKRAALSTGDATERDEEVGGIPVNSDYVIFIVDTSGSMKRIWNKVIEKIGEVLEIHPQVKGFQILSDNGDYLLRTSQGKWRKDTPTIRKTALRAMKEWGGSSNSSPVEGIETALRTYGVRTDSLSLYVFGDDFAGSSMDIAVQRINQLNRDNAGKQRAQIHAVGFAQPTASMSNELLRFSTLMREVTRQNGGTFIAQD